MFRQNRVLKKVKIRELMDYSRQNETGASKSRKNITLKMAGAVLLGILGLLCLYVALTVRIDAFAGFANMLLMQQVLFYRE